MPLASATEVIWTFFVTALPLDARSTAARSCLGVRRLAPRAPTRSGLERRGADRHGRRAGDCRDCAIAPCFRAAKAGPLAEASDRANVTVAATTNNEMISDFKTIASFWRIATTSAPNRLGSRPQNLGVLSLERNTNTASCRIAFQA